VEIAFSLSVNMFYRLLFERWLGAGYSIMGATLGTVVF
jgi:hypothetical protein